MKKYIIFDGETLEHKGSMGGLRLLLSRVPSIAAAAAVILLLAAAVVAVSVGWSRAGRDMERTAAAHAETSDSLQREVDYMRTLAEKRNLYSHIGRLYIRRGHTPCNRETVWAFIKEMNAWYPEYIMAQCIQESGCGDHALPGHNMFGMTLPARRETTANNVGSGDKFAKYNNWELGVIDRVLWELAVFGNRKPSREEYVARLAGYSETPGYEKTIESIARKYRRK